MIVKYMAYDSELYVTDPDDQAGHGETFVVEYNDHVKEMKEVLEWVNNIVNDPMITPRIQQTWKANELLDKYGHLLGDGK